jgi:hypothetical protein
VRLNKQGVIMFITWLFSEGSRALDLYSKEFQELHLDITKKEPVNAVVKQITASLSGNIT